MVSSLDWKSPRELKSASAAADDVLDVMHALATKGQTVPAALLAGEAPRHWKHYPADEARSHTSGYRYYYHCHPRQRQAEHGHFHLFAAGREQQLSHLLGIAIDARGLPLRLFTTNRWVTDEQIVAAPKVLRALRDFHVRRPSRLAPVHRWLRGLLVVFKPQIRALLLARDQRLQAARAGFCEDRRIETLSQTKISLKRQIGSIQRLLPATTRGESS